MSRALVAHRDRNPARGFPLRPRQLRGVVLTLNIIRAVRQHSVQSRPNQHSQYGNRHGVQAITA